MKINELNINSIYDYFVYSNNTDKTYKLVIIITDKQVVYGTQERNNDDHWNMIVDLNKMIYPGRGYDEENISQDTVIFTSIGNDLEVEIPDKVSENQLNATKDILRQVRQFEYEYDQYLYMPFNSHEIVNLSTENLSNDIPNDEDEVIIGTMIEKGHRK